MKKRNGWLIGVLLGLTVLTACSGKENTEVNSTGTNGKETPSGEEQTLTVYAKEGIALFPMAVSEYKSLQDVKVNLELFEDVTEMESRITTEVLSGKGPDVFFFSADYNTLDVHKLMKNGAFYGLDAFMEEEKAYLGFQEEKYDACILESGRYGDEQYILPFSFDMYQFYANSEGIDANYPELLDGYTMRELFDVMKRECVRLADDEEATAVMWGSVSPAQALSVLMEQSQVIFLDYDGKQAVLDEAVVKEIADFWQTFMETQKINKIYQNYRDKSDYLEHFQFLAEKNSLLNNVRHNVSWYDLSGKKPYLYMLPAWETESSYTATICEYGAVNANSAYPKEAYELLRTVMDYQVNYDFNKFQGNIAYSLPVNKDVLHAALEKVKTERGQGKFKILPLKDEYEEYAVQLEEILSHIDSAMIPNTKVGDIVNEVMQPYLEGEKEFESCYKELENRLKLYLNE